jgi:membrane protein implicated in regulation of membrane protease activity
VPWWGWIVVGAALLGSELFLVDADFYLVFLGASALLVGGLGLVGLEGPAWLEWLLFAAVAVASLTLFRGPVYRRLRGGAAELREAFVGEVAVAQSPIAPGQTGRAELRGSTWQARNVGGRAIEVGGRARVVRADGLVLEVQPEA